MVQSREGPRVTPGGLIRPSPLPAGAPTEQEILAGMIGPRPPNTSLTGSRGAVHGQGPMTSNQPNELFATIYRAPFNPEVLKRPEARALQAALSQGHVTVEVLLQHFAHGQMPALQREILLNILKLVQLQGHLGHAQQAAHLRQTRLPSCNSSGFHLDYWVEAVVVLVLVDLQSSVPPTIRGFLPRKSFKCILSRYGHSPFSAYMVQFTHQCFQIGR